jgi:hypothetical protein
MIRRLPLPRLEREERVRLARVEGLLSGKRRHGPDLALVVQNAERDAIHPGESVVPDETAIALSGLDHASRINEVGKTCISF